MNAMENVKNRTKTVHDQARCEMDQLEPKLNDEMKEQGKRDRRKLPSQATPRSLRKGDKKRTEVQMMDVYDRRAFGLFHNP